MLNPSISIKIRKYDRKRKYLKEDMESFFSFFK